MSIFIPKACPSLSSPDKNTEILRSWIEDQLTQISISQGEIDLAPFRVNNVAPDKPRQGMLAYADGTNWNPVSGEGLHEYKAAGWKKLAVSSDIPSIVVTKGFGATKSGDQSGIASATFTKITFTTEAYDSNSDYDSSNSKWTPRAGLSCIMVNLNFSGGIIAGTFCIAGVYKNGALFLYAANFSPSTDMTLLCAFFDNSNGTDYYEVYAYADTAGTKTIAASGSGFQGTEFP